MVFPNHALYPHMPARETVVFALTLKKTDKSEIGEVVLGHIRVALTRC
ncbi:MULTISPECIES: hypothetical protein [unclassified Mesorhizobium]|jgi:multiple sugar transport system ATP-binding protein|nr:MULTISPECIES: hypothetical protein [unclassified Mesorhizobium]MCQ8873701.1 hypothetical protein [Mesorhizobium sp. LMG17149]